MIISGQFSQKSSNSVVKDNYNRNSIINTNNKSNSYSLNSLP